MVESESPLIVTSRVGPSPAIALFGLAAVGAWSSWLGFDDGNPAVGLLGFLLASGALVLTRLAWRKRKEEYTAEVSFEGLRWWSDDEPQFIRFADVVKVVQTVSTESAGLNFHLRNGSVAVIQSDFPEPSKLFAAVRTRYEGPMWRGTKLIAKV